MKPTVLRLLLKTFIIGGAPLCATAQEIPTAKEISINYEESKVPQYVLPDPLTTSKGKTVRDSSMWAKVRRPELVGMFEHEMFGKMPGKPEGLHFKVLYEDATAFYGLATRKEVQIFFDTEETEYLTLLMYVPNGVSGPVPAFLGLNFKGNHCTSPDAGISVPSKERCKMYGPKYKLSARGKQQRKWPFEYILSHGYAVATFFRDDVDPDYDDGFRNGVHKIMDAGKPRTGDSWGTIAAWSWGLSRALDYLETDKDIDSRKVAVFGHSRHGKAALWAGVADPRFALVISNNSGCSGAAISRRKFGENLERLNHDFPHWFCDNYKKYNGKEETLPFDQHELIALVAPRPVYIASAFYDAWADPRGEFLGLVNASAVYELFGYKGIGADEYPGIGQSVTSDRMGYHLREGVHDILLFDWQHYIRFADRFLK